MSFEGVAQWPLWVAVPSVAWSIVALTVFFALRKQIDFVLSALVQRVRHGVGLRLGAIELGEITAVPKVGDLVGKTSSAKHDDGSREEERSAQYGHSRGMMPVHRIFRSTRPDQVYDALIYIVPHAAASLATVSRVEYYFGQQWGGRVFTSIDRARGFPLLVSAYGPFLCSANLIFSDGASAVTYRYIDFEMGQHAPLLDRPTEA